LTGPESFSLDRLLSHIDPGPAEESEAFVRLIYEQRHIDLCSDRNGKTGRWYGRRQLCFQMAPGIRATLCEYNPWSRVGRLIHDSSRDASGWARGLDAAIWEERSGCPSPL